MTPWRRAVWQLLAVYNELTRELETERIEPSPQAAERVAFWKAFPRATADAHETEVDEHMALEERSRARKAAVDIRKLESAWQLTLVPPTARSCSPRGRNAFQFRHEHSQSEASPTARPGAGHVYV